MSLLDSNVKLGTKFQAQMKSMALRQPTKLQTTIYIYILPSAGWSRGAAAANPETTNQSNAMKEARCKTINGFGVVKSALPMWIFFSFDLCCNSYFRFSTLIQNKERETTPKRNIKKRCLFWITRKVGSGSTLKTEYMIYYMIIIQIRPTPPIFVIIISHCFY